MSIPDPVTTGIVTAGALQLAKQIQDFFAAALGHEGESLATILGNVAHRRLKNAEAVGNRARLILLNIGVEQPKEVPLNIIQPIVEGASLQEDPTIQEIWANLLANASDPRHLDSMPASFPNVLKSLSPREVKLLDKLYERHQKDHFPSEISSDGLLIIYDTAGLSRTGRLGVATQADWDKDQEGMRNDMDDYQTSLDILKREGLLSEVAYSPPPNDNLYAVPEKNPLERYYRLSSFGIRFVRACQPPKREGK